MPNNPLTEQQWSKLMASIEWSERQLQFVKEKRLESIKQFVGFHYSDNGAVKRTPVPMLALAVQIYVRSLAAQAPRALITTKRIDLKPTAYNMELAINQIPDEINLSSTLRQFVEEALFSIGVVKVGICKVGEAMGHEYGEPFVDLVTTDNYFCDMAAKSMEEITYEGNQYWLDYEEVKKSNWTDEEAKKDLKPDEYTTTGPAGEDRAEEITVDTSADMYRDQIWVRDIFLHREQKLITIQTQSHKILKVVDWKGPKNGPYIKLGYTHVPGNLLPLPPVALWRDLHELANNLFRKLGNQAEAQKTVQGFQGGDDESVNNFKKAQDGEGIRYIGAEPKTLTAGGVDQKTMAFYLQCRDLFSYYAGNLDSLGGLGNQAPTLGQDKLLGAAASAQMSDMVDHTVKAVREIFYALSFYEWHDPIKRRLLEKPIPGSDSVLPVEWNKKAKKGKFNMYDLQIDIYSLQDNSPGVRLQKLDMIMQKYIMPLAPMIQQAGGNIDFQKIIQMVGKYSDFPELEEIVTFTEQQVGNQSGGPTGDAGSGPANTSHTTTRIGQPGQSREGGSQQMQQILMGGGKAEPGGQ